MILFISLSYSHKERGVIVPFSPPCAALILMFYLVDIAHLYDMVGMKLGLLEVIE